MYSPPDGPIRLAVEQAKKNGKPRPKQVAISRKQVRDWQRRHAKG